MARVIFLLTVQARVIFLLTEKIFQKSTHQKQELPVVAMFVSGSELNEHFLQTIFKGCFLPSFCSFGRAVSEEKIFQKSTNQKKELPVATIFDNGSMKRANFIEDLPQILPTQFRFIWPSGFRDFFLNWPIRNKNCMWRPCLLTDQNEMSKLYRASFIDAS